MKYIKIGYCAVDIGVGGDFRGMEAIMATNLERMRSVICEYANVKPEDITEATNIRTDLSLNSLELVNMAVAIEDEFEVEIPDREALGIETVADAIALIEKYSD